MWRTPKTDWDIDYRWDADDINRIQDNIIWLRDYIRDYGSKLYVTPTIIPFEANKTYASMFYAREMNAIESNLATINAATLQDDIGTTKTYYVNGPTPDFNEFNRIESATLHLRLGIQGNVEIMPVLAFTLGNIKGVKL